MRSSEAFVLGAIVGATVVWLWGRGMEEYVEERTRGVRTKAADGVRAVEEGAGKVLDRGGEACVGLTSSCRTRRSMSARLSGRASDSSRPSNSKGMTGGGRRWSSRSGYARAERPAGRHSPGGGGVVLEEFPGALEEDARDAEILDGGNSAVRGALIEEANRLAEALERLRHGDGGITNARLETVSPEAGRSDGSPRPKLPADAPPLADGTDQYFHSTVPLLAGLGVVTTLHGRHTKKAGLDAVGRSPAWISASRTLLTRC